MQTFSKRNNLKKEYSGFGKASLGLRNRLLQLYGHPYSGNEFSGSSNWIHEFAFDKDLQMHFGKKISIENFRNQLITTYADVFDFIELYYARAINDLEQYKRLQLLRDICLAFNNSGSVYEFNEDGNVIIKIEDDVAEKITKVDSIIEPYEQAQLIFRNSVDGLITRTKDPKDIVSDVFVTLEEYLKQTTKQASWEKAVQNLKTSLGFHPTQIQIIEKLKAYRSDVWGPAHAGNSPAPDEADALWFLESVLAQIIYIDVKNKKHFLN